MDNRTEYLAGFRDGVGFSLGAAAETNTPKRRSRARRTTKAAGRPWTAARRKAQARINAAKRKAAH